MNICFRVLQMVLQGFMPFLNRWKMFVRAGANSLLPSGRHIWVLSDVPTASEFWALAFPFPQKPLASHSQLLLNMLLRFFSPQSQLFLYIGLDGQSSERSTTANWPSHIQPWCTGKLTRRTQSLWVSRLGGLWPHFIGVAIRYVLNLGNTWSLPHVSILRVCGGLAERQCPGLFQLEGTLVSAHPWPLMQNWQAELHYEAMHHGPNEVYLSLGSHFPGRFLRKKKSTWQIFRIISLSIKCGFILK